MHDVILVHSIYCACVPMFRDRHSNGCKKKEGLGLAIAIIALALLTKWLWLNKKTLLLGCAVMKTCPQAAQKQHLRYIIS